MTNSRYLLFFETTIMGKTADLAMIQKTNIDTLHKESKSQRVITERCGCSQSAVSKHIKCKVGRKNLGRKRCTSNRDDCKLENTVKQSWFKHLWEQTVPNSAKATSTWFKDHGIPVLNWPANSPDLNPIENLWGIVKRKMRYARPNNAEELKATIRATWALITPEQCHRLIDSMPRRIAAVIQAKGAPTKYRVLYMLILFSWPRFLKILSLYWS